jgi:ribosomal protein S6--L-glutamate ligase
VAIVGDPAGWHVGRLARGVESRGHRAALVRWPELTAEVGPAGTAAGAAGERFRPESLAGADVVVVRGMPAGSLEEVIFRMDVLGRLAAAGMPVVNAPRSLEVAIDKYLSLARLAAAGLPVPRTIVGQEPEAVARAFADLGGDCVVKPIFGSGGRGLARLSDPAALRGFLAASRPDDAAGWHAPVYLQEFVPHAGWDVRVLVVGDRTIAMRRSAPAGDWRTNVSLGGRPEAFAPPVHWIDLAVRAAAAVGTEVAGVDLLPARDGRVLVLEVNAVPGWRGLESATGIDIAKAITIHLEDRAAGRPAR